MTADTSVQQMRSQFDESVKLQILINVNVDKNIGLCQLSCIIIVSNAFGIVFSIILYIQMTVGQLTHLPQPTRLLELVLSLHPPVHPTPLHPLHPAPHPHQLILPIQKRNRRKDARRKKSTTTTVTRKSIRGRKKRRKKGHMASREVSVKRGRQ